MIPDGKNHGLVFVLDWSGSMAHVMEDTIKQLYNLIWFCRKVSIPFDVYAFTNEYPKQQFMDYSYEKKDGLVCIDATFSMMNLFTSSVNNKTLETQMINVFRIARALHYYGCAYPIPTGLTLSGTPLCESFITLHQILPQFQKKNGVEKVQCIVLSDGEPVVLGITRSSPVLVMRNFLDWDALMKPQFSVIVVLVQPTT